MKDTVVTVLRRRCLSYHRRSFSRDTIYVILLFLSDIRDCIHPR